MVKLFSLICLLSFLVSPTAYGEDSLEELARSMEALQRSLGNNVAFESWKATDATIPPYSDISREQRFSVFIESLCHEGRQAGSNSCDTNFLTHELIHQSLQALSVEDQVAIISTHEFNTSFRRVVTIEAAKGNEMSKYIADSLATIVPINEVMDYDKTEGFVEGYTLASNLLYNTSVNHLNELFESGYLKPSDFDDWGLGLVLQHMNNLTGGMTLEAYIAQFPWMEDMISEIHQRDTSSKAFNRILVQLENLSTEGKEHLAGNDLVAGVVQLAGQKMKLSNMSDEELEKYQAQTLLNKCFPAGGVDLQLKQNFCQRALDQALIFSVDESLLSYDELTDSGETSFNLSKNCQVTQNTVNPITDFLGQSVSSTSTVVVPNGTWKVEVPGQEALEVSMKAVTRAAQTSCVGMALATKKHEPKQEVAPSGYFIFESIYFDSLDALKGLYN